MKFIFSLIKVLVCIGLALLALMLLINQTFLKDVFLTKDMSGNGIPVERFTYMFNQPNMSKARFISLASLETLNKTKEDYMSGLKTCYGMYHYDKENDITILKYNVSDSGLYRNMFIEYVLDNYCSDDYILSDSWIHEYNNYSKLEEISVSEASVIDLIGKLFSAKRNLSPVIPKDYKAEVTIELHAVQKDGKYYIDIKDFGENEILVVKTKANQKQFAVYTYEGAKEYLKSLK